MLAVPITVSCSGGPSCSSAGCGPALTVKILPKTSESLPVGVYEIESVSDGAPGTVTCYSEPTLGKGCTGDDSPFEISQRLVDGKLEYISLTSFEPVKLIELAISRDGTSLLTTTLTPDYSAPIQTECSQGCSYASEKLSVD